MHRIVTTRIEHTDQRRRATNSSFPSLAFFTPAASLYDCFLFLNIYTRVFFLLSLTRASAPALFLFYAFDIFFLLLLSSCSRSRALDHRSPMCLTYLLLCTFYTHARTLGCVCIYSLERTLVARGTSHARDRISARSICFFLATIAESVDRARPMFSALFLPLKYFSDLNLAERADLQRRNCYKFSFVDRKPARSSRGKRNCSIPREIDAQNIISLGSLLRGHLSRRSVQLDDPFYLSTAAAPRAHSTLPPLSDIYPIDGKRGGGRGGRKATRETCSKMRRGVYAKTPMRHAGLAIFFERRCVVRGTFRARAGQSEKYILKNS